MRHSYQQSALTAIIPYFATVVEVIASYGGITPEVSAEYSDELRAFPGYYTDVSGGLAPSYMRVEEKKRRNELPQHSEARQLYRIRRGERYCGLQAVAEALHDESRQLARRLSQTLIVPLPGDAAASSLSPEALRRNKDAMDEIDFFKNEILLLAPLKKIADEVEDILKKIPQLQAVVAYRFDRYRDYLAERGDVENPYDTYGDALSKWHITAQEKLNRYVARLGELRDELRELRDKGDFDFEPRRGSQYHVATPEHYLAIIAHEHVPDYIADAAYCLDKALGRCTDMASINAEADKLNKTPTRMRKLDAAVKPRVDDAYREDPDIQLLLSLTLTMEVSRRSVLGVRNAYEKIDTVGLNLADRIFFMEQPRLEIPRGGHFAHQEPQIEHIPLALAMWALGEASRQTIKSPWEACISNAIGVRETVIMAMMGVQQVMVERLETEAHSQRRFFDKMLQSLQRPFQHPSTQTGYTTLLPIQLDYDLDSLRNILAKEAPLLTTAYKGVLIAQAGLDHRPEAKALEGLIAAADEDFQSERLRYCQSGIDAAVMLHRTAARLTSYAAGLRRMPNDVSLLFDDEHSDWHTVKQQILETIDTADGIEDKLKRLAQSIYAQTRAFEDHCAMVEEDELPQYRALIGDIFSDPWTQETLIEAYRLLEYLVEHYRNWPSYHNFLMGVAQVVEMGQQALRAKAEAEGKTVADAGPLQAAFCALEVNDRLCAPRSTRETQPDAPAAPRRRA